MNAHRNLRLLLTVGSCALVALAAAVGCSSSDARPCNDCPQVAGQWTLHFETGTDPSAACEKAGKTQPPELLDLAQVGSGLTATYDGVPLRGTLYDTYDFSLNGNTQGEDGGTASVAINGRYVPPVTGADAGERLQGTFVGTYGTGAEGCMLSRGYTGERL